jgi:FAD synthase
MGVQFIEKIRDEKKFHSLDALTGQIADDCVNAKTILAHNPE